MCEISRDVSMGQEEANTHEFGASLGAVKYSRMENEQEGFSSTMDAGRYSSASNRSSEDSDYYIPKNSIGGKWKRRRDARKR